MLWKILAGVALVIAVIIGITRQVSSTVIVERTLNAPVEKVWKVWTTTESIQKWWSPKDFTAPVIKNDFRVGGTYLFSMQSPKNEMFWNTGTYTEITLNQKIAFTVSFADENGKLVPGAQAPAPGKWPDSIMATVTFQADGGKTHVRVEEVGIPLIMKILAKMGWEQQFDKFERLL